MRILQIDHLKVIFPLLSPPPAEAAFVGLNPRPQIKSYASCVAIRKFVISAPELIAANQAFLSVLPLARRECGHGDFQQDETMMTCQMRRTAPGAAVADLNRHAGERRHIDHL